MPHLVRPWLNMPDVTVIEVRAIVPNPHNTNDLAERQILMVECKRPSSDTPSTWDDIITGQFADDISQNLNAAERPFGAVAIGTKVRFYRFDGKAALENQLSQLHQGTFDMVSEDGIV